jgi:hypothetical protein
VKSNCKSLLFSKRQSRQKCLPKFERESEY